MEDPMEDQPEAAVGFQQGPHHNANMDKVATKVCAWLHLVDGNSTRKLGNDIIGLLQAEFSALFIRCHGDCLFPAKLKCTSGKRRHKMLSNSNKRVCFFPAKWLRGYSLWIMRLQNIKVGFWCSGHSRNMFEWHCSIFAASFTSLIRGN